jgi:hypothetical protein
MFYNYKDFFSPMVLMVVADTNCRFMYVDISSYGKDCGSTVFKRFTLWTLIQTNMLELPNESPLSGTEGPNVPHFFVGDDGFALNRNILRPFVGSNLSVKKRVYNYRLCRTRRYVECAFGILSNKWRIFQRPHVSPDFEVVIVKASVVLHNFVRERDG